MSVRYTLRIVSTHVTAERKLPSSLSLISARAIARQWAKDLEGSAAPFWVVVCDELGSEVETIKVK